MLRAKAKTQGTLPYFKVLSLLARGRQIVRIGLHLFVARDKVLVRPLDALTGDAKIAKVVLVTTVEFIDLPNIIKVVKVWIVVGLVPALLLNFTTHFPNSRELFGTAKPKGCIISPVAVDIVHLESDYMGVV